MTSEERDIQRKLRVLQHAEKIGNARKACRYFGIGRSSFYRWRDAYQKHGEAHSLIPSQIFRWDQTTNLLDYVEPE
jgi:transposase-like protein